MQKGVGAAAHRWHQRCGWLWAVPAALLLHLLVLGALGGPFPHSVGGLRQARSGEQPLALWVRLQAAPPRVLTHDALAQPGASNLAGTDTAMEQATGQAVEQATEAQQGPSGAVAQDPATPPVIGSSADVAGAARPVLASRAPPNFHQALQVRRGAQSGHGLWSWSMDAGRYRTELNAQLGEPQGARAPSSLNWSSRGGWDKHGVAPERFLTQPSRGGARAVNFQRDTGRVSYSGPTGQSALVPGAQDRLSWLVQLLALVQAHPPGQGLPAELPLWVAGPQGDGGDWWFQVQWEPATQCWRFTRRADRRYDVQVQAWVAGAGGPQARLVRLEMGHEGSRQAPWLLMDAEQPAACGHAP